MIVVWEPCPECIEPGCHEPAPPTVKRCAKHAGKHIARMLLADLRAALATETAPHGAEEETQ